MSAAYSFWRGVWWALDATPEHYAASPYGGQWPAIARNIRQRDRMCCRDCGADDVRLDVHHRWHLAQARRYGALGLIIANLPILLRSLCRPCHARRHNNTFEEVRSFSATEP